MHPHLAQALTAERIRGWQEEAAQARLAKEVRRARRGRRGWGAWRIRVPATTGLASRSSRPTSPAPSVTAQGGATEGRPATADERLPTGADERLPVTADELLLATADEHQPMTADEHRPVGPRAA